MKGLAQGIYRLCQGEDVKMKNLLSFSFSAKQALSEETTTESNSNQNEPTPTFSRRQKIGLVLGPLLYVLIMLFFQPSDLSPEGKAILAATVWIATWWMTEAIPIFATALLPLLLFPLSGGMDIDATSTSYASDTIFLFMGGFIIALGIEKWNLHKRIALSIINAIGTNTDRLILGFMVSTAFLSMWISSTATAMMMLPIGTAILHRFKELMKEQSVSTAQMNTEFFGKALMLGIGYSALTGGIGTLIGTPPNIILAGYVSESYGLDISFGQWMLFGVPIAVVFTLAVWWYLVKVAFPVKLKEIPQGQAFIKQQYRQLGAMTSEEKMIGTVFTLVAVGWITRSFILEPYVSANIDDSIIAMAGALILFLLPSKQEPGKTLMQWHMVRDLPWGILILFGGGLAIAAGFESSGLTEWIGAQLTNLSMFPLIIVLFAVIAMVMLLTEITSNTATATMLIPIMGSLALALEVHPYTLIVGTTVGASCAFMFPIASPPNAIVYSSGLLKIGDMAKAGVWLNIGFCILLTALVYWYLPVVWKFNILEF